VPRKAKPAWGGNISLPPEIGGEKRKKRNPGAPQNLKPPKIKQRNPKEKRTKRERQKACELSVNAQKRGIEWRKRGGESSSFTNESREKMRPRHRNVQVAPMRFKFKKKAHHSRPGLHPALRPQNQKEDTFRGIGSWAGLVHWGKERDSIPKIGGKK